MCVLSSVHQSKMVLGGFDTLLEEWSKTQSCVTFTAFEVIYDQTLFKLQVISIGVLSKTNHKTNNVKTSPPKYHPLLLDDWDSVHWN